VLPGFCFVASRAPLLADKRLQSRRGRREGQKRNGLVDDRAIDRARQAQLEGSGKQCLHGNILWTSIGEYRRGGAHVGSY
jgi:hypothetical protein